jgi:magnesium transporter
MINTYTYKNLSWIDLESPTEQEVLSLLEKYHIHSLIGEDILSQYSRPRIERYPDHIYMVLRIPERIRRTPRSHRDIRRYSIEEKEINFIIGRDFIITTHRGPIESVANFAKVFETNSIIAKGKEKSGGNTEGVGDHAGYIFYYLMKRLYARVEDDLESIRQSLMHAEEGIFDGKERRMVEVLSNISRELTDLKQSSRVHKEVIEAFGPAAQAFFGQDFKYHYVDDIIRQYGKIHEITGNNHELLNDLRETNDSLLSTKQNDIMQTLTVVASIIFPLELVTGIFSMNTIYTPIVGMPHDFGIIMIIMAVLTLAMIGYFKYKRWV